MTVQELGVEDQVPEPDPACAGATWWLAQSGLPFLQGAWTGPPQDHPGEAWDQDQGSGLPG